MQTALHETLHIPLSIATRSMRPQTSVREDLESAVDNFKRVLAHADRAALKNDNVVPASAAAEVQTAFTACNAKLNSALGGVEAGDDELGVRVQSDLLPYMLLTNTAERWYSKPRGYAGDFLTIHHMYENQAAGLGRIGPVLDRCFLDLPAANAVRNRRGLLAEEIEAVIAAKNGGEARVTSLACGPATELFDVFRQLDDPRKVKATLIDIDLQALAFVGERRDRAGLRSQMRLVNANLIYLAKGRESINLAQQDLIYSIGLIDYFSDKFVVSLLNYIHNALRPGGKVILGNFHPRNPDKALMDHVFDWRLIHRAEDDMNRLFRASAFGKPSTRIRFEGEGINMFAECTKRI